MSETKEQQSEMVERVAKALWDEERETDWWGGAEWNYLFQFAQEPYLRKASVVIAAMREPTEAMIAAGDASMPAAEGWDRWGDCRRSWQAMIDEALK